MSEGTNLEPKQLSIIAFEDVREFLPCKEADEIAALIYEYNEWGVGIEMMIDILVEEQIVVSSNQKNQILIVANEMKLERGQGGIHEA